MDLIPAGRMREAGWAEAAAGCDYVLHVASPLGVADPKDPNDLIVKFWNGRLPTSSLMKMPWAFWPAPR